MKEVSPSEAHDLMQKEAYVYLDVRTEGEFAAGHPAQAFNVPAFVPGPGGQMMPNPDFLKTVQGAFGAQQKMVVGCMAGGRSMRACQLLEQAGYQNIANVRGGFGGARDPSGRTDQGWSQLGLPVSKDTSAAVSYQGLKEKAAKR